MGLVGHAHVCITRELGRIHRDLGIDLKPLLRQKRPRLYLDKNVLVFVTADDVRLALRAAPVPVEDLIALRLEKGRCNVLAQTAHFVGRELADGLLPIVQCFHDAPFDAPSVKRAWHLNLTGIWLRSNANLTAQLEELRRWEKVLAEANSMDRRETVLTNCLDMLG